MSDLYGFCLAEQDDVPATDRPICATCGYPLIPPRWANHTDPWPWPPRPEGYVYTPPAFLSAPVARKQGNADDLARHRKPAPKKPQHLSAFPSGQATLRRRKQYPRSTLAQRGQVCDRCGASDVQAHRDRLCRPCYRREKWVEKHGTAVARPCRWCGKAFTPDDPKGRNFTAGYCSDDCRRARIAQRLRDRRQRRKEEAA